MDPSKRRKEFSDLIDQAKVYEKQEEWDSALDCYKRALTTMELLYKCKHCSSNFRGKRQPKTLSYVQVKSH